MNIVDILTSTRDGLELSTEEIRELVAAVTHAGMEDSQIAAWLMAAYLRGLTYRETRDLTLAMRDSGKTVDTASLPVHPTLDKHSTGGVGDKTSLVVVPILAAAGIPMLKMSGRGLGHSGGTVDKLEAIPGFRTEMPLEAAKRQVSEIGAALIGQSAEIAPADKILYGLRDVTATVDSLPLIASSIMSKKLASGADRILLDVKAGRGAFMKTREQAEELARLLIRLGQDSGVPTLALLSSMDQPLGRAVGNALEVAEAVDLLLRPANAEPVFLNFCLDLAAHGLLCAGRASFQDQARAQAEQIVKSGRAASKFAQICAAQGGPADCEAVLASLPAAPSEHTVTAPFSGVVSVLDAEAVGKLAMELGAGRRTRDEPIDPAVGIVFARKVGDEVESGQTLATLHIRASDEPRAQEFAQALLAAIRIEESESAAPEHFWTLQVR